MALSAPKPLSTEAEAKGFIAFEAGVQSFLQQDFDPADYLNSTLPTPSFTSTTARRRTVPLSDLSAQLQTLLSQLNAQTTRLSATLTQLTDEIIRSGSRLAYEVEVLRGETRGLTDALDNGLRQEIELFVPARVAVQEQEAISMGKNGDAVDAVDQKAESTPSAEPEFLERLQTLSTVRERLDSVIKTFGSAMQWPVAPSELSVASSFISVSAPDNDGDNRSREEKGKEHTEKLRSEVSDLLATGKDGFEAASTRVDELRLLAEVWKGTAEEKARLKIVETLQKLVDEKHKELEGGRDGTGRKPGVSPSQGHDYRYGNNDTSKHQSEGGSGYGFLQNLRNLKNEMYLD